MLRDLIDEKGESVYRVAKGSGIPYTTLNEIVLGKKDPRDCSIKTIAALADYWGMELGVLYNRITEPSIGLDLNRINPLRRSEIFEVIRYCSSDKRIKKVILFGSSIRAAGKENDDIDLAIELDADSVDIENDPLKIKSEIYDALLRVSGSLADIVWLDTLHKDSILQDSISKGLRCV